MANRIKKIIEFAKWPAIYTGAFSSLAAIGNAFGESSATIEQRAELFREGFLDALPAALIINSTYAKAIDLLNKTKHPRLYSNLLCGAVQIGFYLALKTQGTENSESAMVLPAILGFTLTNLQNKKVYE